MKNMLYAALIFSTVFTSSCEWKGKYEEAKKELDETQELLKEAKGESEKWRESFEDFKEVMPKTADAFDPLGIKIMLRDSNSLREVVASLEAEIGRRSELSPRYPFGINFSSGDHNVRYRVWLRTVEEGRPDWNDIQLHDFESPVTGNNEVVLAANELGRGKTQLWIGVRREFGQGFNSNKGPNIVTVHGVRILGDPPKEVLDTTPMITATWYAESENGEIRGPYQLWEEWSK